ncbi:hypothetical protein [Piscinibacter sakaiensis]|uniref:Uncharacterized protein n=1 Tax=Piscinibacter sakaiensis TaxID=1547922 RepID=A0A0K8P1W2_PISS1|nr:hypothetical protein [Piscinibacter sakaiensis]GAP36534.1 hypothetical protein ISF6_2374 [Piscinibacter sakaiensis]
MPYPPTAAPPAATPAPQRLAVAALLLAAALLPGCAQLRAALDESVDGASPEQFSGTDKHGAYPAIRRKTFEQINLVELIDPAGLARAHYPDAWQRAEALGEDGESRRLDLALADFRSRLATMDPASARRHRNGVQDRMLQVSTSRCNVFKTYLRRQQSDTNFLLGSATTVAGVLGAILPGVNASRNLAGTAGIFSGVQAEFNSSYYSNLAAHVIVQGIETLQQRLLNQLMKDRQTLDLTDYGMEAAIKDALYLDGTCSTVAGLIEAAESIKESTNPGLPRAAEVLASVKAMQAIAQAEKIGPLAQTGELEKLLKLTAPKSAPLVASVTAPSEPGQDASRASRQAAAAPARLALWIDQQAAQLPAVFAAAQAALPASAPKADAGLGAKAAQAYRDELKDVASQARLPECVAALRKPAQALAEAEVKRDLAPTGGTARIQAETEVAIAAAQLLARTQTIEWQLAQAVAHATARATAWKAALGDKAVQAAKDVAALGVKPAALDTAPFKALDCPAPG